MAFASGGYHGLYYVAETTYGVTPTSPAWTPIRHTDCGLQLNRDKFDSKELRSDRAMTDVRLGTYQVTGDVGVELSYGTWMDDLLQALMGGTWTDNVLNQGTTQRSFSILRRFSDITQYQCFTGCVPSKFTLDVKPNGIVTATFSFVGSDMTTSLPSGSTYNSASTNSPMDAFSASVLEGGLPTTLCSGITVTLDNGIEANYVVGSKYAPELSWGRSVASGEATFFFENLTMFNKFVDETASSLQFETSDGSNSFTWLMNNVKYTSGANPVPDEKPIVLTMGFDALHDESYTNLQITRNPNVSKSPSLSPSKSPSTSPSGSPSLSPSISPSASPS